MHYFGDEFFDYKIHKLLDIKGSYPVGGLVGSFFIFINIIVTTVLFCFDVNRKVLPAVLYPVNFTAIQLTILALVIDGVYLGKMGANIITENMKRYSDDEDCSPWTGCSPSSNDDFSSRDIPSNQEFAYATAIVIITGMFNIIILR